MQEQDEKSGNTSGMELMAAALKPVRMILVMVLPFKFRSSTESHISLLEFDWQHRIEQSTSSTPPDVNTIIDAI